MNIWHERDKTKRWLLSLVPLNHFVLKRPARKTDIFLSVFRGSDLIFYIRTQRRVHRRCTSNLQVPVECINFQRASENSSTYNSNSLTMFPKFLQHEYSPTKFDILQYIRGFRLFFFKNMCFFPAFSSQLWVFLSQQQRAARHTSSLTLQRDPDCDLCLLNPWNPWNSPMNAARSSTHSLPGAPREHAPWLPCTEQLAPKEVCHDILFTPTGITHVNIHIRSCKHTFLI